MAYGRHCRRSGLTTPHPTWAEMQSPLFATLIGVIERENAWPVLGPELFRTGRPSRGITAAAMQSAPRAGRTLRARRVYSVFIHCGRPCPQAVDVPSAGARTPGTVAQMARAIFLRFASHQRPRERLYASSARTRVGSGNGDRANDGQSPAARSGRAQGITAGMVTGTARQGGNRPRRVPRRGCRWPRRATDMEAGLLEADDAGVDDGSRVPTADIGNTTTGDPVRSWPALVASAWHLQRCRMRTWAPTVSGGPSTARTSGANRDCSARPRP
jgi:hypothetical protein